jgi:uncharacterized protein
MGPFTEREPGEYSGDQRALDRYNRVMGTSASTAGVRSRLQAALRTAMKERDMVAVSGLRSALAAIANAEAVPPPAPPSGQPPAGDRHVAGSVGPGGGEASRRAVAEDEATAIAAAEVTERRAAARDYEAAGHRDRARRLLCEAQAIAAALDPALDPALNRAAPRDDA